MRKSRNNGQLFDGIVLDKEFLQSNWEQWKQEDQRRDNLKQRKMAQAVWSLQNENHIAAPNLIKIVGYAFCLSGTSAPVERVFSLMNNAWADDRGLMKKSTVKGLMICKINIGLDCEDFYNKIKTEKTLSKKSTCKYCPSFIHCSKCFLLLVTNIISINMFQFIIVSFIITPGLDS